VSQSIVIVTGASSGLGEITAHMLARVGHVVFASMRDPTGRSRAAVERIEALAGAGFDIQALPLDVTDEASVDAAVRAVIQAHGRVDVVINNAGVLAVGVTESFTIADVQAQLDTNVLGVMRVNRAVLPHMRARRSGLLVHVSSVAGRLAFPFLGVYAATKGAVEALAEAYSHELAPFGVDSVVVEPGPFGTRLIENSRRGSDTARSAAYAETNQLPGPMLSRLNTFLTGADAPDPALVAAAIAGLIERPPGQRPRRTVAGIDCGVRGLNDAACAAQRMLSAALLPQRVLPRPA
jgi:NAD(P)-dependent dehydrogenase (short-subunit alcohol dehydrogenase family)